MPTHLGPNISEEENLVFYFDTSNFPHAWGLTQLVPNSEFIDGGTTPYDHGCYSSGHYLGPTTSSSMISGVLRFTGGDLSNYYTTNPEYRGWDQGSLGTTGGNWMNYIILPESLSASEDYIVETRARFVYVSKTGNGSINPRFQIGRHYNEQYGINYNELGTEFKTLKFSFNGNSVPDIGSGNSYFTFGCTSADAMVELDYLRLYRIEKNVGLKNLVTTNGVNLSSVSFDSNAQMVFDGTNDGINLGTSGVFNQFTGEFTIDTWVNRSNLGVTWGNIIGDYYTNNTLNALECQILMSSAGNLGVYNVTNSWIVNPIPSGFGPNTWVNVVLSRVGSTLSLYANSNLITSVTNTTTFGSATGNLRIGVDGNGVSEPFTGFISSVKIYNRGLTSSEVLNNYNNTKRKYGL